MGTWWIPPSGSSAMTLEIPDEWGGRIEDQEQLLELAAVKIDKLLQENREDPDGTEDTVMGLETLESRFGLQLTPESVTGIQITTLLKWRLLELCRTEDNYRIPFPQQATTTEDQDPRETFSEWVDRIAL